MSRAADVDIDATLERLAQDLLPLATAKPEPVMVGIRTGGAWVAGRLHRALDLTTPLGTLDSSFYRDDFSRIGLHPRVEPSAIATDIEDACVILVDDVLHTGRTLRAALNEIFDYGRPAAVRLAVLADRGGRELPVAADYVGVTLDVPAGRQIKLTGPDPLRLEER